MLEQVLRHLNNWFLVPDGIHSGEFTVQDGSITLPFHQYPEQDMTGETFTGAVWALAVPKAVITLSEEIAAWNEKNGTPGPYTSESFGGYSYSKATNASGVVVGWQDVFKSRLNAWRRIGGII